MTLSSPAEVQTRLQAIEDDLAKRQNLFEEAAEKWFIGKRDREKDRAVAFLEAKGSVAERNAHADATAATNGAQEEALFEALKAAVKTLEARATICQSILKAQSRV